MTLLVKWKLNNYKSLAKAETVRPQCVFLVHCAVVRTLFQTFGCRDQGRDSVPQCCECQREEIQKARVNGGSKYDSLKDS